VKAAAAPGCLDVALDHWIDSDGQPDLTGLLDEAFTALAPHSSAAAAQAVAPPRCSGRLNPTTQRVTPPGAPGKCALLEAMAVMAGDW
jgi:hypothetical protein